MVIGQIEEWSDGLAKGSGWEWVEDGSVDAGPIEKRVEVYFRSCIVFGRGLKLRDVSRSYLHLIGYLMRSRW